MPKEISSAYLALFFVTPIVLCTLLVATVFSGLFWLVNKMGPISVPAGRADVRPSFGDLFLLSSGFGGFGFLLGSFVGITQQSVTTAVLGTLSTIGVTSLAMLYGKDAIPNSSRVLPCALLTLFVCVVMAMEFGLIAVGGHLHGGPSRA